MKDKIFTTISNQKIEEIYEKVEKRRYFEKVLYPLLVVAFCILLSAAICLLPALPGWTLVFCIVAVGAALLVGAVFYAVWPAITQMILLFNALLGKEYKDYADVPYIKLDDWIDRQKETWVKWFMAIAALFAFVVFSLWLKDGRYIQWALGAAAALAICRMIWLIHKNFDQLENSKDILLGTVTVSVTVLLGLVFWVPQVWGFSLPDITVQDLFGYYTAQLSLTFISISVMSVLSDRSVVIYWENVAQRKLIKPVFASFASYTYYSIGTTVGAGISVLLGKAIGFYVFFALNVLVLILLTLTMVDVYYGREKKKEILKKQLMQESLAYLKSDLYCLTSKKYNSKDKDSSAVQKRSQDYEKHMLSFQQNIYRAREEHDLVFLQEAFDLCVEFRALFTGVNGLKTYRMITYEHNGETWQVLQTRLSSEVEKQEQELSGIKKYFDEELKWAADEWIWTLVVSSSYLREWLRNFGSGYDYQRELWDFMMLVLRRFVLLFNQMALDYNTKQDNGTEKPSAHDSLAAVLYMTKLKESMGNEWIPILHVEEKYRGIQAVDNEGKIPQYEVCRKVMEGYMSTVTEEPYLLAKLVGIVAVMLQELGDYYRECLVAYYRDFPMFQVITRYFQMLNIPQYQEVWGKAFQAPEEE